MTKIEEIKDKVYKGHYIFAKESYHGTTWMDSEAEEDVEYLLKELDKLKTALKWYANHVNFSYAGMNEMYARSMSDKAAEALKEEME